MGFTLRKSIKIGKNTRVNLSSKGGIGISTGVKGARISTNRQGTRIYCGTGILRYQKQISSNEINTDSDTSTVEVEENNINNTQDKKPSFVKRYYKEIIAVILGFLIGTSIGGIGKVDKSDVSTVRSRIKNHENTIYYKNNELEDLNSNKAYLEGILNKQ